MLEELCRQAGLVVRGSESWEVRWRRRAGEPSQRALVVLDDLVDPALLEPIAAGLGEQSAILVTTQFGDAVEAELRRRLPASAILRRQIEGMAPADAQRLFAGVLGRPLAADEYEKIAEAGDLLGWHAGALAFAAAQVRQYGWDGLLAGLREGGLPADRLSKLVRRQWERLAAEQRTDLSALVRYARGRGPFGLPYAMAAWDLKHVEIAEMRLTQLERAGLIERLQAAPDGLYLSSTLWRVAPVVERVLREAGASEFTAEVRRALDRSRLAGRLQGHAGSLLHMPWQFQLLETPWWLLWGALKLLIGAPLWLISRLAGSPRPLRRWLMWTLPGAAEEHLQAHWQRLGLEPSQEVRLLYDAGTLQGIGTVVAAVAGIVTLGLVGLLSLNPATNIPAWGSAVSLLSGAGRSLLASAAGGLAGVAGASLRRKDVGLADGGVGLPRAGDAESADDLRGARSER